MDKSLFFQSFLFIKYFIVHTMYLLYMFITVCQRFFCNFRCFHWNYFFLLKNIVLFSQLRAKLGLACHYSFIILIAYSLSLFVLHSPHCQLTLFYRHSMKQIFTGELTFDVTFKSTYETKNISFFWSKWY